MANSVRITSSGNGGSGTHIYDAETERELSGLVEHIEITLDACKPSHAAVRFLFPEFDVIATADIEEIKDVDLNSIEVIERLLDLLEARLRSLKGASHAL